MGKVCFCSLASLLVFFPLFSEPPGSSTQGTQYREKGRIVSKPKNYNTTPYYYQGDLIYEGKGSPYRDRSGRIQYGKQYTRYPYRRPSINYEYEKNRITDKETERQKKLNPSPQGQAETQYQSPQQANPAPVKQVQPKTSIKPTTERYYDRQKSYEQG